ncbi:MAG: helix-turn-helix transcriptional regulator [Clostridiales bacterium]|nr:helix-turn-helix transcriptional regulator [Clostridiales bacterium]
MSTFVKRWNQSVLSLHSSYTDAFYQPNLNTRISSRKISSQNISLKDFLKESYIPSPSAHAKESLYYLEILAKTTRNFPFTIEMKDLDSFLLLYTKKGRYRLTYDNNQYVIGDNSFIFLDCTNYLKLDLLEQNWDFEILFLNGQQISYYYQLFQENGIPYCNCIPSDDSITTLHKLFSYEENNSITVELIRSSLLTSLLTNIILTKHIDGKQSSYVPNHIKQMMTILQTRYTEKHTLDSLSEELNYNKYKLAKDFKRYVHRSPIDYLIDRRMEVAKQLLLTTNKTVNEIAESIGIANTPHFIHLFKTHTTLTPLQYREKKSHYEDFI